MVAAAATVTDTSSVLASIRVTAFTVTPVPPTVTVAPTAKLVPTRVMIEPVAPWPTDDGVTDASVGPAVTVKAALRLARPPSRRSTVTSVVPSAAVAEMFTGTVAEVAVETVTVPKVTPAVDAVSVIPAANPLPVRVSVCAVAPWPMASGDTDVSVGAAAMVSPVARVAAPSSGLVTVIDRAPMAASAAIVRFSEIEVAVTVDEFTVMPVPENAITAPAWNPVPATV